MKQGTIYIPIQVEERLPDKDGWYLCRMDTGREANYWYNENVQAWSYFPGGARVEGILFVTHWLEKQENGIVCTKEELEEALKHSFEMGDIAGCGKEKIVGDTDFHNYMDKYLESKGIKP